MAGAPTLKDVAAAANVHQSTASRALHAAEPGRLPPDLVQRVRRIADELGYSRNAIAASLRTRRSRTIGVVVTDLTNTMFPPMLRGIEDRLDAEGYSAIIANTDFVPAKQNRIVDTFLDRRLDGVILATARLQDVEAVTALRQKMPVVLMNRDLADAPVTAVIADAAKGIASAVEHLVGLGHRRIAHIAGPQDVSTGVVRRNAFIAAIEAAALPSDDRLMAAAASFSEAEGVRCGRLLLEAAGAPTAIVAANDWLAIGCIAALEQAGLSCPSDMSVTGFNDMPFADRVRPPLTTVRFPHHRMGYEAADELLALIANPARPARALVMPPQLIVRGSTARPGR